MWNFSNEAQRENAAFRKADVRHECSGTPQIHILAARTCAKSDFKSKPKKAQATRRGTQARKPSGPVTAHRYTAPQPLARSCQHTWSTDVNAFLRHGILTQFLAMSKQLLATLEGFSSLKRHSSTLTRKQHPGPDTGSPDTSPQRKHGYRSAQAALLASGH